MGVRVIPSDGEEYGSWTLGSQYPSCPPASLRPPPSTSLYLLYPSCPVLALRPPLPPLYLQRI
eukprot:758592-Hanusia_phi.AAC.9